MANEGVEDSSWAQNGDEYEVTEDIEVIQNSDNAQDINLSSSVALEASGDSASIADGASEDVGDYDPESVDLTPLPQLEPAQSRQSSPNRSPRPASNPVPVPKKRKTAGGFLVGDSDSEDDTPAPTSTGSHPPPGPSSFSHVAPQPVAQSPLRTSVPIHEAQEAVSNVPSTPQGTMNALAVPAKAQPGSTETVVQSTEAYEPPQDFVTTLEERIKQDPKAALDAWLELIAELRRRNDIDALRDVYERFLAIFPQSADIWTAYMEMELELNNFGKAEDLFKKTLTTIQNVKLLTVYLDYIRRRNDLSDPSGRAREVVTQSFEFVLNNDVIGVDRDSGPIWTEYIQFIKTGPGSVGDQDWESKKKMDSLRRVYQRAIAIPTKNLNTLWREYEQFENSIDRKLGRAMVSQHSPSYMSAKSANMALDNITRRLQRSNLPRLPPAPGFDGDEEYMEQVDLWKRWIDWEKSDPLELATDEPATLKSRILYIYRQALMALRFWPDMWVEAAEWCWENDVGGTDGRDQGLDFLLEGIEANPENVLLALKHGDRVEGTYPVGEGDEAKVDRGNAVRAPYIKVQDSLYELAKKFKEEEKAAIDRINSSPLFAPPADKAAGEDDEDADASGDAAAKEAAKQAQIKAIQQGFSVRNNVLSKTISYVWIALARAMRRVQGTGAPQAPIGGLRHVFWEARQRGKLSSDVYVAVALMEWKVYKDNAGAKIFERGAKLFPEDEYFIVEYLKFLHSRDDFTNARVAFENCAKRLTEKPSTIHKARAIFSYFHKYESDYGDRSQIVKLEQRMAELFPDDPKLKTFAARFSSHVFDPITTRIIISPYQMRPKNILPSIEQQQQQQQRGGSIVNSPRPSIRQPNSPRPQHFMPMMTNSPKRPLPQDEFDDAINPPRKMQRGESPLKGAAGRRLDQQRRVQAAPIARDITFLLGLLPTSSSYTLPRFNAAEMVRLVNNSHIPEAKDWKGGNNPRVQMPPTGGAAASHNRQISASYATRDSPTTATRTQSPFDNMSRGRIATAASTYHQPSGLRPGSSSGGGGFDAQAAAAAGMGVYPPPGSAIPTPDASGIWGVVPPGYGAPPPPPSGAGGEYGGGYGQAPPYGRYY